jgi:hypothetical protein
LVFEKNANFRRKLAKIAENCDHNIDPRRKKLLTISQMDFCVAARGPSLVPFSTQPCWQWEEFIECKIEFRVKHLRKKFKPKLPINCESGLFTLMEFDKLGPTEAEAQVFQ